MAKFHLVHTATGKQYEILHINRETGKMRLQGPRAVFEEDYDPAQLKQRGYVLRKGPDDAEQQELHPQLQAGVQDVESSGRAGNGE